MLRGSALCMMGRGIKGKIKADPSCPRRSQHTAGFDQSKRVLREPVSPLPHRSILNCWSYLSRSAPFSSPINGFSTSAHSPKLQHPVTGRPRTSALAFPGSLRPDPSALLHMSGWLCSHYKDKCFQLHIKSVFFPATATYVTPKATDDSSINQPFPHDVFSRLDLQMSSSCSKNQRPAGGGRRSTEAMSKLKYLKTEKLLRWTADAPDLRIREAALHLFEDTDEGFIPHLLGYFDTARLHSLSSKRGDPEVIHATDSTTQALLKLTTVFQALSDPPSHPNALAFSDHTHRCTLEQWDGITKWMLYLLRASSASGNPRALVKLVNQALIVMLEGNEGNTYKQELISSEFTIDIIYTSLCLIDPETRNYHYIATTDRHPCCILDLLSEVVARNRKALVTALVDRPQIPFWKRKAGTLGAVKSRTLLTMTIFRLITSEDGTGSLWRTFNRTNWLHVHLLETRAIANKVHQEGGGTDAYEYWWNLGGCLAAFVFCITMSSPNPSSCIHKLVEDGVLGSVTMAIPYMDDTCTTLSGSLTALMPYIYLERVMKAVQRRGDDLEFMKLFGYTGSSRATYMEYANALNSVRGFPYVHAALHPEVNMCSNLGVSGIYVVQRLDTWANCCAVGSILFQTHRSREESRRTGRVGTVILWPTAPTLVKGKTGKGSTTGNLGSFGRPLTSTHNSRTTLKKTLSYCSISELALQATLQNLPRNLEFEEAEHKMRICYLSAIVRWLNSRSTVSFCRKTPAFRRHPSRSRSR
ncbi:hypothetical protein NMY22_g5489 [Coprinellus aureogranulatus]|nr:hypothetical protein NMY22_g5489 [Coprinellus aureogranulatus]